MPMNVSSSGLYHKANIFLSLIEYALNSLLGALRLVDYISIFDNKFFIPLDFEILESGLPFYQFGLGSWLTRGLAFTDYSDVIKSTNADTSYTISNIFLEFDTVTNASLANQIRTEHMKSSILYDRVLRSHIIPLMDSNTSFSVNSLSKSL